VFILLNKNFNLFFFEVKAGTIFDNMLLTDDKDLAAERRTTILAGLAGEKAAKEEFDTPEESEDDNEEETDEDEDDDDELDEDVLKHFLAHVCRQFPLFFFRTQTWKILVNSPPFFGFQFLTSFCFLRQR
jgi:hypothetical protein